MSKKQNLPAMPLYIGDWDKDPAVKAMTAEDEGIYFRLIKICWESEKRGFLQIKGKPIPYEILSDMIKLDNHRLTMWLTKYQDTFEIFGIDECGVMFSKKILEILELSKKRKTAGKQGGNPNLVNQQVNQKSTKSMGRGYPNTENENINEDSLKKEERKRSLKWPELKDVVDYFTDRMYPKEEAELFWNHYESQGWITGNAVPITNWRVKAENWHKNNLQKGNNNGTNTTSRGRGAIDPEQLMRIANED